MKKIKEKERGKTKRKEEEKKLSFIKKVKGILFSPRKTFQELIDESFFKTLKFYFLILLIISIFFSLIGALSFYVVLPKILGEKFFTNIPVSYELLILLLFGFFIIGGLIFSFITGLILHVFVKFIGGGKKSYKETIRAVMYGLTPLILFWWIPFLQIVTPIWAFLLILIGIKKFQEISRVRAILVMVVPIVIFLIIGLIWKIFL